MSTKYNLPEIRNALTDQMERVYPKDLESMEDRDFGVLFADYENMVDDHEFQLLVAVEQSNLKTVLPSLYFECAIYPLDTILNAAEDLQLERQQVNKLLRGHERMVEYSHEYGIKQFMPEVPCMVSCSKARGQLLVNYVKSSSFPIQQLLQKDETEDDDSKDLRKSICKTCSRMISATLEDFRLEIWNAIPELFGLGTWEDAKRD